MIYFFVPCFVDQLNILLKFGSCLSGKKRINSLEGVNTNVNFGIMRTIIFYKTATGKCPVTEFFDTLNARQVQKIAWVLSLIETRSRIPSEYLKKLSGTSGLWEIRIQLGSDIFRLLGFMDGGELVVLTNGFAKKTQKTPLNEIRIAELRKKEYLNRKNENQ